MEPLDREIPPNSQASDVTYMLHLLLAATLSLTMS